jgi:hypothetical protein
MSAGNVKDKELSEIKHIIKEPPLHTDFFICPEMEMRIDGFQYTNIENCESFNMDEGCRYLKTCNAYKKKKAEEPS